MFNVYQIPEIIWGRKKVFFPISISLWRVIKASPKSAFPLNKSGHLKSITHLRDDEGPLYTIGQLVMKLFLRCRHKIAKMPAIIKNIDTENMIKMISSKYFWKENVGNVLQKICLIEFSVDSCLKPAGFYLISHIRFEVIFQETKINSKNCLKFK